MLMVVEEQRCTKVALSRDGVATAVMVVLSEACCVADRVTLSAAVHGAFIGRIKPSEVSHSVQTYPRTLSSAAAVTNVWSDVASGSCGSDAHSAVNL
jgi:hypothetical protein